MADYHNQLSEKLENDLSKAILLYIKEKQKSKKNLKQMENGSFKI